MGHARGEVAGVLQERRDDCEPHHLFEIPLTVMIGNGDANQVQAFFDPDRAVEVHGALLARVRVAAEAPRDPSTEFRNGNHEGRFENSVAVLTNDCAASGAGTLWATRMSFAVTGFP